MVEILRNITQGLGWQFYYGRRDFDNLVESQSEDDNTIYFFLDPVTRNIIYSDTGTPTGRVEHTGSFMILTKSDLDQEYDEQTGERPRSEGRWLMHIKPKMDSCMEDLNKELGCEDSLTWESAEIVDIINVYDNNFDGISVTYKFIEE